MLTFSVNKQIITRTDNNVAIADSVDYLTATFSFSEEWELCSKTIIFRSGDTIKSLLLENDTCIVPWEVINLGGFKVSVIGVNGNVLITTNVIDIPCGASGYADGEEPEPPTPSEWQQIMAILAHLQGGAVNKVLAKKSSADYDFKWVDNSGGGGGGGSSVEWTQLLSEGTKIATITIDDEPYDVYAPTPFSGNYNDLTNKPTIPDELADLLSDSTHRTVTDTEKSTWNNKSDFSGSYNDLTNKPTIPAAQVNSDWSASSGVAQILNKPTIPTKTSDLTNDSNYQTANDVSTAISTAIASVYRYKGSVNAYSDLPVVSQVTGDVYNVVTADPTHHIKAGDNVAWNGSAWDVLAGDIDLSSYQTKNLSTTIESATTVEGALSALSTNKANTSAIPTKTSQLTNDSGFLTQHQSIKTLNGETLVGTGDVSTYQSETVTVSGGTASKQLTAHKLCVFDGAVLTLTVTFPATVSASDEFNFVFETSSNGCTLTVPNTVKWDGGTAPTLEANTKYEVSIDGLGIALISQGVSTTT